MRSKLEQRIAAWAMMLALAFLAGCDSKPKGKGNGTGTGTGGSATAGVSPSSGPTARQAADGFLKALTDGQASPEQLTSWFKKQSSKPIAELETADWLAGFKGTTFVVGEEVKFGNTIVLRGRAESSSQKDAFTLRVTKEGDAFKVDWLQRSGYLSSGISSPSDAELAAAQDAVRNFLDLLLRGDLRQAQALMTVDWKKSESPLPPGAKSKDGFDYDTGFLARAMIAMKKDFSSYGIKQSELNGTKDGATFSVEMDNGPMKSPYTVKAKKIDGQWLIESFSK